MLLCIDIGNTNIMIGLYEGEELGPHWRIATIHERMPDEFAIQLLALLAHAGIDPDRITGVALASGVPGLTSAGVKSAGATSTLSRWWSMGG